MPCHLSLRPPASPGPRRTSRHRLAGVLATAAAVLAAAGCTVPAAPDPSPGTAAPGMSAPPATAPTSPTTGAPATTTTAAPVLGEPTRPVALREHLEFGAYVDGMPWSLGGFTALEGEIGTKLDIASSFVDWTYVFGGANDIAQSAGGTRQVLYSWDPNIWRSETDITGIPYTAITSGRQDAYFQRIVESMKRYPHEIIVRPWAEMNGEWAYWHPEPGKISGGTPAEFVAAWRYVVDYFRSRGVTNLKFMFNPDAGTGPGYTPIASIWPGAEYVDLLGIDGYNWGDVPNSFAWQEFEAIFAPMYDILTGLHPTAEVWLPEMGSKEPTVSDGAPVDARHSKGRWIENMMATTRFPRITAAAWFNTRKERDWRLESSTDSLDAIRRELARRPR